MGIYGLRRRRSASRSRLMSRLRAAAAIAALAVIWLGYWVAIEHANQRERRAAAVPASTQALAAPASTPTVEFRVRKKATDQAPDAPTLKLPKFSSAGALAVTPHPGAQVSEAVDAVAATTPATEPLPELPAHVPFFQAALSDAQGGIPGAHGRRGAMSGASIPPMWGFGGGGAGSAPTPVATDDTSFSGDGRPNVLGHKFAADSGEASGGTGSNSSNGSGGGSGSNGSTGSNDQNVGTQSVGSGSSDGTGSGGGSSAAGGSTQGAGSNGGSNGGGSSDGGAVNSLAANLSNDGTADVTVDVPEPGSILLGLGLAAAFLRRRAR